MRGGLYNLANRNFGVYLQKGSFNTSALLKKKMVHSQLRPSLENFIGILVLQILVVSVPYFHISLHRVRYEDHDL